MVIFAVLAAFGLMAIAVDFVLTVQRLRLRDANQEG
jgi:hypothetical protein